MKKLIIVGASGHGRVVADIALLNSYEEIVFIDGNPDVKTCAGFPVIGNESVVPEIDGDLFIAIGNNATRKRIMEKFFDRSFPVLVHPTAVIAKDAQIGKGTVIAAGVVVNPNVKIGRGCIVNTSSSIDHDCVVGDYVHVAVGARLCGTVCVGDETFIGAGVTVINNTSICSGCTIGAGASVIKNIENKGIYIGIPARLFNKNTVRMI